jgi:hypothetical protein
MAKLGYIPDNKLLTTKSEESLPKEALELANFLKFPVEGKVKKSEIQFYGSFNLRIQPYPSDIDTMNHVYIDADKIESLGIIQKGIQKIARKLDKGDKFFTDFKCGTYYDNPDESMHWTRGEVLKGKRDPKIIDYNGNKLSEDQKDQYIYNSLIEVDVSYDETAADLAKSEVIDKEKFIKICKLKGNKSVIGDNGKEIPIEKYKLKKGEQYVKYFPLCKMDMVAKYYDVYLEVTCVYFFECKDGPINYKELNDKLLTDELAEETYKQEHEGKTFKAIKRIYANARLRKDIKTIRKIEKLLVSNVSKLSSIGSDISTISLLIELKKKIDIEFTIDELQRMKDKLGTILDLKINDNKFYQTLDKICDELKNVGKNRKKILTKLGALKDVITHITTGATKQFLKSKKIKSFDYFGKKYFSKPPFFEED